MLTTIILNDCDGCLITFLSDIFCDNIHNRL